MDKFETFLKARVRVLEHIVEGGELSDTLDLLCRDTEEIDPALRCSILYLDQDTMSLHPAAAPSLPDFFVQSTEGLPAAAGVGSCGTAAYTGERVIVEDVSSHPFWEPARELTEKAGIKACWSQPIYSKNREVLGTFAMYYDEVRSPQEEEIQLIQAQANLASLAIERKRDEEALRESEERFRSFTKYSPHIIHIKDTDGRYLMVNPQAEKLFGTSNAEVRNKTTDEVFPRGIAEYFAAHDRAVLESGKAVEQEERFVVDGEERVYLTNKFPIRDAAGNVVAIGASGSDITMRKKMEGALRESEQSFRLLFHQSPSGVCLEDYSQVKRRIDRLADEGVTDFKKYFQEHDDDLTNAIRDIRLIDANNTLMEMFGTTTLEEYRSYEDSFETWNNINWRNFYIGELSTLAAGEFTYTADVQDFMVDGTPIEVRCTSRVARGGEDDWSEIISTHEDITARKIVEEQLLQQATIDHVTGLPNRALLFDRLTKAIEHAQREKRHIGLIFVDLDRFKHINDTHGHTAGDILLKKAGERLRRLTRQEDTVARMGGDEFLVLLNDIEMPNGPETVAKKIGEAFMAPFDLDGIEAFATVSLGITLFPDDGDEPNLLIKNADAAMYESKRQGRNTYRFFTRGLNDLADQHGRIAERLRHAMDRGDLELHYQPIIDVHNNHVTAVEALIRWDDAVLNVVAPEQLVTVAEKAGFMLPIDNWVLNEACNQVATWRADIAPLLELSVNVSRSHFRSPGLVQSVERVLANSGLPATSLMIEITENVLIEDSPKIIERLNNLSELGVSLALDDFGTGYSSLGYLKRFKVNVLKIDRTFIQDIPDNSADLALIEAIIAMSHSLYLSVIAEGIETPEQLELLRARGCHLIQGFHFCPPLSAEQMTEYLAKWYRA